VTAASATNSEVFVFMFTDADTSLFYVPRRFGCTFQQAVGQIGNAAQNCLARLLSSEVADVVMDNVDHDHAALHHIFCRRVVHDIYSTSKVFVVPVTISL
jgi:hypothetical protein